MLLVSVINLVSLVSAVPNKSCTITDHYPQRNTVINILIRSLWAAQNVYFLTPSPSPPPLPPLLKSSFDQKLFVLNQWRCRVVLTGVVERGLVFSTANLELGEGMLLCNSFSHISIWISGTRCISSVFSSATISLVSTSPRRTAPITLAATGILSSFLCLIHCITDLKTNVSEGALRSSRPIRFKNWSASIWDKNSSLPQTS